MGDDDNYAHSSGCEIVDIEQFHFYMFGEETNLFDMTSLSTFMLLREAESQTNLVSLEDENENLECRRLSLAYEKLSHIPPVILEELAPQIKILDISHNEFRDLQFLTKFWRLTSLICDHNNITSSTYIPYMPNLELLWLNHCKIVELYPFAQRLRYYCPNLKYLSLMGNPAAPSYLNGGTFYEYLQYRLFILSLFPNLRHLDDKAVTEDQVEEAVRLYKRPLIERVTAKTTTTLPEYVRCVSDKVSGLLIPLSEITENKEKNLIV